MSDPEESFDLAAWQTSHGLNRRTTEALGKEDFTTRDTLLAMMPCDISALNITIGQSRVLKTALGDLGNPAFKPTGHPVTSEQNELEANTEQMVAPRRKKAGTSEEPPLAIPQAEEALDRLLAGDASPLPGTERSSNNTWRGAEGYDPRMLLTIRASSKKALQATGFVPDAVRQRLARKRRETMRWTEGLSQAEWGAANIRLMHRLMTEGDLPRSNIEDYLTYTVMVHEFASRYDWQSVLDFDVRYRELQAQHGFRWGTTAIHLEAILLTSSPRVSGPGQAMKQQQGRRPTATSRGATADAGAGDEICRLYASRGDCPYGDKCRFQHKRN